MIQYVILGSLSVLILAQPYLGIVITLASLPLTNVLPTASWSNSVLTMLGGVTLGSAVLYQLRQKTPTPKITAKQPPILLLATLLLIWIIATNPSAAMTPDDKGRVWAITFVQLWFFAALTSFLMDTPRKVYVLTWAYVAITIVSASYAVFQQGDIGGELTLEERAVGLAGGANTAARYFVSALMLGLYLYQREKRVLFRWALLFGVVILIIGVVFTVSRTGLLLLAAGAGLFVTQKIQAEYRLRSIFIITLGVLFIWFAADNITTIIKEILPTIMEGTDTLNTRYRLWQAGWRMWLDYPIAGVGIGKFNDSLPKYAWDLLTGKYLRLGAHNMYVSMLAETGLIGLFFFVGMFAASFRALNGASNSPNEEIASLARIWLIVLILAMLGGLTKHDHYEKLNWIIIGVSACLSKLNAHETQPVKS